MYIQRFPYNFILQAYKHIEFEYKTKKKSVFFSSLQFACHCCHFGENKHAFQCLVSGTIGGEYSTFVVGVCVCAEKSVTVELPATIMLNKFCCVLNTGVHWTMFRNVFQIFFFRWPNTIILIANNHYYSFYREDCFTRISRLMGSRFSFKILNFSIIS